MHRPRRSLHCCKNELSAVYECSVMDYKKAKTRNKSNAYFLLLFFLVSIP